VARHLQSLLISNVSYLRIACKFKKLQTEARRPVFRPIEKTWQNFIRPSSLIPNFIGLMYSILSHFIPWVTGWH
jgi:hypothetical protein